MTPEPTLVAPDEPHVDLGLLREVAASVDAIVWSADTTGRFLYLNAAVERLTGFPLQTFLDDRPFWQDRIHPEDRERVGSLFASAAAASAIKARYRFLTSAGEYRVFKMLARVYPGKDGAPVRVGGVTVDVTEHDRRDGELHAALDEARAYRNLFTNANALAAVLDLRGTFTLLSPAWRSVMGYDPRNLAGRSMLDIIHPDDVETAAAAVGTLLDDGEEVSSLELRVRCYDRSYRWLLWNMTAGLDGERLYGIAQDVSERRLAELVVRDTTAALRDREAILRQTQALAQLGGWQWDVATDTITWSDEIRHLIGLAPDEPVPSFAGLARFYTPESWTTLQAHVASALERGTSYEVDLELVRADGAHRWTVARGEAVHDADGRVVQVRGTWQDVTAQRTVEQALRTSEQRLRAMASEVPGVIYQFRMKPDGTFEFPYVSDGLRRLFHLEPQDAYQDAGRIWTHVDPEQLGGLMASIAQSAEAMTAWTYDFDVSLPDGDRRRVHGASRPQQEPDGSIVWSGLLTDITAQRAQEQALVRAREEALAASREKSLFLANMSHEIRTPMNGILGMTELALGTTLTDEQREYLETVRQSGEMLLGIVNDILDLSKIEARHITLERVPFALRRVVNEAVALLMPRAHEKGLAVSVDVHPDVPERVLGDPLRLNQVLRNFFANAVKFTHSGSIAVRVFPDPDGMLTRFSVSDTGVGIASSDHSRIFDAFAQSDSSTTRRFGGTGLGLSIARQLSALMGGRVWVESALGQGSTFHLAVPLPGAPAGASMVSSMSRPSSAPAPGPRSSLGLRVLVVEDNPINARVVARMLERLGCDVEGADGGVAALEVLARERFDVVLMDIQMSDLDGFETTRRLRVQEQSAGTRVPVVALTANAMKGDDSRCLDAGMDGYLAKPIAMSALEAELRRVAPLPATPM